PRRDGRPGNAEASGRKPGGARPGGAKGGAQKSGAPPAGSGGRAATPRRGAERVTSDQLWLFGEHAVLAAIRNPRRTCHQLLASEDGMPRIRDAAARRGLHITP